ncbi:MULTISPECIES: type VI secretion system tip protein VgrG [unclassified Pseudomonas]|uniref:type VI secretion system Vgr family protein n=1 Tax=unclassified Pseudomonas TaxID=196821 RepID=UPI00249AA3E1|nr:MULTISPECIES: type VI secretion system tip protein VgrG [unclassified Pseudomonas]MDI3252632.1 type VI secretion system tip protein TssI/VgrG [Pseudomonas sp. AL10]MDI3268511.1 type VI secretion system tip protein TssI/VgrG [Pseudomonas sp. AL15]
MPRQSDLRFTFEPLKGDAFDVVSFTLEEGLSQPFKLELQLASHNAAIDFNNVLDLTGLFTIWRGETPVRYVHGLVSLFTQGDTGFRRTRYTAVIEPTLARFNLRSNWRIFQGQTVPDIITNVLAEQKLTDLRREICFEHQSREYCVQAGETDLDFIARLAAEEGLLYTFEHRDDGHTLVLTDRVGGLGTIGTHKHCPVIYQPMAGGDATEPALTRFHYTEQVRTARQVQRDYTFTHPRYDQQHTATGDQDLKNQHKDYERYDYPGRYKRDIAGKPFTKTRLTALRNDAKLAHLAGDDARLQPGLAFDLNEHPREDFNDRWRTIAITHEGKQHTSLQEEAFGSGHGTSYEMTASAIRWTSDWKAPLRDKPCIDGPQIATVVGPPGEEIYCDEWGRVKVQFPWDRADKNNDQSSCWIRVAQGWAGATWGAMAVPRVDQELIISFLDGDPDQPIATGRTYRETNLPPYELPKLNAVATTKSREFKGTRANELRIDDTTAQISAALMSDHEHSALHLGYLTHPRHYGGGKPRGEGFELRTDGHGALRAAKGLLLTAEAQLKAAAGHLERQQVIEVLQTALALAKQLGSSAEVAQGIAQDWQPQQALTEAVNTLGQGANDQPNGTGTGAQPIIALSGPAGIAAATSRSIAIGAGEHIDSVAQQNLQLTAGKKVVINAGDELGLFAQGGDMRHIAQNGQLLLQAQHNSIQVQADQSVEISASQQHVLVAADKHITLLCGGAYIKMQGGNIELGMPGDFIVKAANKHFIDPSHAATQLNSWPSTSFNERFQPFFNGQPMRNRAYALVRKDGACFEGRTDGEGYVTLQQGMTLEGLTLEWLENGDPI